MDHVGRFWGAKSHRKLQYFNAGLRALGDNLCGLSTLSEAQNLADNLRLWVALVDLAGVAETESGCFQALLGGIFAAFIVSLSQDFRFVIQNPKAALWQGLKMWLLTGPCTLLGCNVTCSVWDTKVYSCCFGGSPTQLQNEFGEGDLYRRENCVFSHGPLMSKRFSVADTNVSQRSCVVHTLKKMINKVSKTEEVMKCF